MLGDHAARAPASPLLPPVLWICLMPLLVFGVAAVQGNVRGLLGSLQTVLWEDSGWKPLGMGDLLEPAQVRKAWMKANLLVHPDKVRQRNGTDEQVAIADMIFDALKEAWGQFRG